VSDASASRVVYDYIDKKYHRVIVAYLNRSLTLNNLIGLAREPAECLFFNRKKITTKTHVVAKSRKAYLAPQFAIDPVGRAHSVCNESQWRAERHVEGSGA